MIHRLRKLKHMSADELRVRMRQGFRRRKERRRWRQRVTESAALEEAGITHAARRLIPGCCSGQVQQTRLLIQRRSVGLAEIISSGRWSMLGHSYDLTGAIDWHTDPRSNYRWPRDFYADLALYDLPGETDVKYVWELGRQQYVVELARGWLFSGESQFAAKARDIVLDWIEHNPLYEGVHWTSALEVAMRAISWIWTLATLADWDGWNAGEIERIGQGLVEHATYLEHHLEFYSSPYNHLIGEATALYLISQILDSKDRSRHWCRYSREVLNEYGPKQFYRDGFCVEQATGYHYYTLGFLTMAVTAARSAGDPLSELEPVVHNAYRAGMAFRRPDGRWPAIGDVDSARAIPVHHDDFWDFTSLCAVGAVLFDDPELKVAESGPGEELYWLMGGDGVAAWQRLEVAEKVGRQTVLEESGYAIASDGSDWVAFDAGPVAAGLFADGTPSTAHGHADALQVLYCADGKPVLHDSGMPFYGGDPDWVQHFRSAAAHNTLAVEGLDFVRQAGRLTWSHAVPVPTLAAEFDENAWLLCGRAEWSSGTSVERHVLCLPGEGLWIADWIRSDRPRDVHWYWQFPGSVAEQCFVRTGGCVEIDLGDLQWSCLSSDAAGDAWFDAPNPDRPQAWRCPGYGTREPSRRVVVRRRVQDSLLHLTAIARVPQHLRVEIDGVALEDPSSRQSAGDRSFQLHNARWSVNAKNAVPVGLVTHPVQLGT